MAIGINNKVKVFTLIIGEEEVCRSTDSEFVANFLLSSFSAQEDGFLGEVTLRIEFKDKDQWEKE